MDATVIREYYKSALYALSLGTPRGVIQYGELVFAEEDNFEAAEGFKKALEDTEGKVFNCRLMLPDGYEIQPLFTEEDTEDFYNDDSNFYDYNDEDE